MKKIIYTIALLLGTGITLPQQASDYFPEQPYARWEYKLTVLDSLSNEIDSLHYYRHDKIIDEAVFEGKQAKILQTKSGPAETIYFQPYLDSIFFNFSGSDGNEYFKVGYVKLLLSALDSVLNIPDFNFVEFFTSFEDWYAVYRFNQPVNDEYTILLLDTSVTIDTLTIPLRLEVRGVRLPDDSISTLFKDFSCKKFARKIVVSLLLNVLPPLPPIEVPIFILEDYIWIAEGYWIVRGVIPPINIDFSELNINLPSFYIPGLITDLEYTNIITSVEKEPIIPEQVELAQNYPNPFNPSTTIKFSVIEPGFVSLKIYNSIGEEVAVLLEQEFSLGSYKVEWNAAGLPSGFYFYQLKTESFVEAKKMIFLK